MDAKIAENAESAKESFCFGVSLFSAVFAISVIFA